MKLTFQGPKGATADLRELEYVSTLHQTDMTKLRKDASIRDVDIQRFLMSRYGIEVSSENARKTILQGLGGSDKEGESLDLMEVVAILLIPTLLKIKTDAEAKATPFEGKTPDETMFRESRTSLLEMPCGGVPATVLRTILEDATGSADARPLSRDLVRQILTAYDEDEIAQDDALVDDMFAAAAGSDGEEVTFDAAALLRALTTDVQQYDPINETKATTFYFDVFGTEEGRIGDVDEETENILTKKNTLPSIDYAANTYKYRNSVVSLRAFFTMLFLFLYANNGNELLKMDKNRFCTEEVTFGCSVGYFIVDYLFRFFFFGAAGTLIIGAGSLGNDYVGRTKFSCFGKNIPYSSKKAKILGLLSTILFLGVPTYYVYHKTFNRRFPIIYEKYLLVVFFFLSLSTLMFYTKASIARALKIETFDPKKFTHRILLQDTQVAESHVKQAAAYKMNLMMKNAIDISRPRPPEEEDARNILRTHFGRAIWRFESAGENEKKDCGGFLWTWRRMLSGELMRQDGIWLPARVVSGFICLVLIAGFILFFGLQQIYSDPNFIEKTLIELNSEIFKGYFVLLPPENTEMVCAALQTQVFAEEVTQVVDKEIYANVLNNICIQNNITLEDMNSLATNSTATIDENIEAMISKAMIEMKKITGIKFYWPLVFGTLFSFGLALLNAMEYLPQYAKSVLQLRLGVIPSFHDYEEFSKIRKNPNQVSVLTGYLFWGAAASSIIIFGLVTIFASFLFWEPTQKFILGTGLPVLLGILATVGIKMLLSRGFVERSFYAALFRTNPFGANISSLFFETATFVLSVLFVGMRLVILLVLLIINLGRIDLPFLASGVGIGPADDKAPYIYRADILISDAHRHPYMELLGSMYLMKLRHGRGFGKACGSTWRLIFLYALMPWLSKFRIKQLAEEEDNDTLLTKVHEQTVKQVSSGLSAARGHAKTALKQIKNEQTVKRVSSGLSAAKGHAKTALKQIKKQPLRI